MALLYAATFAASCPSKDDSVTDLPNFDKNYTFPCTYSGFVEVDKPTDSNLFYWFFRDEKLSDDAPLVLWINGGPGSTSQFGNLIENGPFKLVRDDTGTVRVHSLVGQAWNAVSNIVYLDQPVGVGYSYGHLNITDVSQVKEHTLTFIQGFLQKHPEMQGRDFFIAGESYGGKYEPAMASAIIDHNAQANDDDKIPLKGVLIGNGFVDPVTQRLSIRHLSLALGSIQFDSIPELDTMEQRWQEANGRKDVNAPDICGDVSGFISHMDGGMDMYDARWPSSNSSYQDVMINEYLNLPNVVDSLHVGISTKETKFALSNETVGENYNIKDGMLRYIDEHQKILDNNITLLIFVGQFDRKDGPYGVQEWMKELQWDGMQGFRASSRHLYYYVSDDSGEVRLGGNFKRHRNLNVFMVYAAGHLVPSTQLATSRSMLADIIYEGGLQCHHEEQGKCSLDEYTCHLMRNCSGNGDCVTGHCVWEAGFHGADCSITTTKLDTATVTLRPTEWVYYKLDNTSDRTKLTTQSNNGEFEIYTRKGDIPTTSFHDWFVSGTKSEFLVDISNSGEFIALFNPDLENSIVVNMSVTRDTVIWSSAFWICLALAAVLAILSMINTVYFIRLRKTKNTHISLIPQTIEA